MGRGRILWAVILLSAAACAQDFPDAPSQTHFLEQTSQPLPNAPSHHRFWDRGNKTLFLIHAGLETADFVATHHNISHGGRELNPMGKALCESGTAGQVVFFAGRTAGVLGTSYLLHKTGHHKLERVFLIVANADSAFGVGYSFGHK
jgi:hypothetical protein